MNDVPGLIYKPDFVSKEEESTLVAVIDANEWNTELRRRVQHYGWKYDYTQREIDASMRIGTLPDWAQNIAKKLVQEGLVKELPNQLIVNEYLGSQGISRHIDRTQSFTGEIATISLLETWCMLFRYRDRKKVEKCLERRSVAVLTGEARYQWSHEIPARKYESFVSELGGEYRVPRSRRISLTYRRTRHR